MRRCGQRGRRLGAVAVIIAAAVGLPACGSSSSSSSTSSSTTASPGAAARNTDAVARARVQAAGCMRSQGIDIPDITPGSGRLLAVARILGSYPSAKVQAAMTACAASIKQAFPNLTSITPAQRQQRLREAVGFSQCMRSHGINYPDPSTVAGNPAGYYKAIGSIDVTSPAFKAAAPACRAQALKNAGG